VLLAASVAFGGAAVPEQIHIAFTQVDGTLSVDFVGSAADGVTQVGFSANPSTMTNATTTSFNFETIGWLHQGLLSYPGAKAGQSAYYRVCSGGECSAIFTVVPIHQGPEVYAVFGDFGLTNDESMADLVAEANAGRFDAVLHVGDFACKRSVHRQGLAY
jgi:hypothetical protein